MSVELSKVHVQRIAQAVQIARAGGRIVFRINEGEPATIVWYDAAAPRVSHVISRIYGQRDEWMAAVLAEFHTETAPRC